MKITDILIHTTWVGFRNQLLVKIETDEGIYGWGESGLSSREFAVEGALRHFREFLIGRDPMQRARLWQELYRSQYFEGGSVLAAAISAVDIALHDVVGKKLGVPVYELLGGRQRDWVPLFPTTTATDGSAMLAQAREYVSNGWEIVRFAWVEPSEDDPKIFEPRRSIATTAEWLARAREEFGHEIVLGIDWHHRLSVAETISFCRMLPPHTLDFLEEPIRHQTPSAYEALQRSIDIPLAIGEEFSSKWQFLPFVERDILGFARIDVCNMGGLTEAMKVAGWAEAHYIDVMPHNPLGPVSTAAAAHLAMAVPNFAWLEIFEILPEERGHFYNREIFPIQPEITDRKLFLPDRPGLGVEVNEEALAAYRPAEMPHLRRRDGSVTNW